MKAVLFALTLAAAVTSSFAAPTTYNDALSTGIAAFDATVQNTGAALATVTLVAGQTQYDFIDKNGNNAVVSVSATSGNPITWGYGYTSGALSLSGDVVTISPSSNASDPVPGFSSGLTFTFSSAVNAFGFEIGDWATCCQFNTRPQSVIDAYGTPADGTGLWIGFNGGALRLIANSTATDGVDNPGWIQAQSYTNFIGSIDDTGDFTSVTFFGDGFGEYLVAGGTLRFASVAQGSVSEVPEPSSIALLGLGLLTMVIARKRRV